LFGIIPNGLKKDKTLKQYLLLKALVTQALADPEYCLMRAVKRTYLRSVKLFMATKTCEELM
jgi:hypothetical protein